MKYLRFTLKAAASFIKDTIDGTVWFLSACDKNGADKPDSSAKD